MMYKYLHARSVLLTMHMEVPSQSAFVKLGSGGNAACVGPNHRLAHVVSRHHCAACFRLSFPSMSAPSHDAQEILSGLEKLIEKYFDKDDIAQEKTPLDKFWGTYLRSMKDEDEARPKDWDGNTGSILTFVRTIAPPLSLLCLIK